MPSNEATTGSPVEQAKKEITHDLLAEFFGPEYKDQTFPRVKVHHSQLEGAVIGTLSGYESRSLFSEFPDHDKVVKIVGIVLDVDNRLPKSFLSSDGLLYPEGEIIRSDIIGIVDGTTIASRNEGLFNERQIDAEEA